MRKKINNSEIIILLTLAFIGLKFLSFSELTIPVFILLLFYIIKSPVVISAIKWNKNANYLVLFTIVFVIYALISLTYTRAPKYGFSKIYLFIVWSLIGLGLGSLLASKQIKINIINYNYYIFIFYLIIIYLNLGGVTSGLNDSVNQRIGTETGNPIAFGRYMGFGIIGVIMYLISKHNTLKRSLKNTFLPLMIVTAAIVYLIFSGSRGPIVSLLVAGLYIIVYFFRNNNRLRTSLNLLIILSISSAIFYFMWKYYYMNDASILEFVQKRYLNTETTAARSAFQRLDFYSTAWNKSTDNIFDFIFGHGIGDFGYLYYGQDLRMYPHNIILEVLYELGLLGLMAYMAILLLAFRSFLNYVPLQSVWLRAVLLYFFINANLTGDISGNFALIIFLYAIPIYIGSEKSIIKFGKI